MTEQDESKDFAKGGIITGPAMPMHSECCHLRHEQYAPIKITINKEIDAEAIAEAISTQLRRRSIL